MGWRTLLGVAAAAAMLFTAGAASARAEGALVTAPAAERVLLYVFVYRAGPAWKEGLPMAEQDLRPHGAYIKKLHADGVVFAGGRFTDRDGGMAIVRAISPEDAQAILAADPAITSGVFTAEILPWAPRFHDQSPLFPAN